LVGSAAVPGACPEILAAIALVFQAVFVSAAVMYLVAAVIISLKNRGLSQRINKKSVWSKIE
jgi:hypothetical protein